MTDKKFEIEKYDRKTVFAKLKQFCYFADEHDYIEVVEWNNGEGFDVEMSGKLQERFQMTYREFQALKKLVKVIEK